MKTPWLVFRLIFEGVVGFFMLFSPIAQLPTILRDLRQGNHAGLAGTLIGVGIMVILGFYVFRDAVRVMKRIRKNQTSALDR